MIARETGVESPKPVCAAAYFAYERQPDGRPFEGNVLVCEVDDSAITVALCRVAPEHIRVRTASTDEHTGEAFDQRMLRLAYEAESGLAYDTLSPHEKRHLAESLSADRQNEEVAATVARTLDKMEKERAYGLATAYVFGDDYHVTFQQMLDAFGPMEDSLCGTLAETLAWAEGTGEPLDAVLLTGAFAEAPLVHRVINRVLKGKAVVSRRDAGAAGAALIAEGRIEVRPLFPHTLGFAASRIVEGQYTEVHHPIVEGGRHRTGGDIIWATDDAEALVAIEVFQRAGAFPLWIQPDGTALPQSLDARAPEAGTYEIGLRLDAPDHATLFFRKDNITEKTSEPIPLSNYT